MKFFNLSVLILSLFFFGFTSSKAQSNDDCRSIDPCPTITWNSQSTHVGMGNIQIDFLYYWRICNGIIEFKFATTSASLTAQTIFNTGSDYQKDYSGLKEFIEAYALWDFFNDLIAHQGQSGWPTIPDCPNPSQTIEFYTARCGMWVKCSYPVNTNEQVQHDNCLTSGDCPPLSPWGGINYIDIWQWKPCGTACCKKNYIFCFDHNSNAMTVQNVSRGPAPGTDGECNGTRCQDWRLGGDEPCYDGCLGDGSN